MVGVDNDAATIETARVGKGRERPNVSFELADAVAFLRGRSSSRFDAVVCFEGLEHLEELDAALERLRQHAERGMKIVASLPNGKLFEEHNPYHVTQFGYDEAIAGVCCVSARRDGASVPRRGFADRARRRAPAETREPEVTLDDRDEPEYANHFIFCVNFDPAEVERFHHGRVQLNTSPVFNRWAEDLKRGAWALRRENARLARAHLGKDGSAAAATLARLAEPEQQIASLRERCRVAEAKVRKLQAAAAGVEVQSDGTEQGTVPEVGPAPLKALEPRAVTPQPGEDPNSWEMRRRRAAEVLIPWIEQTVPLAGKTVLEYGCGNAAVSCAFAQRAGRVIGLDIDPGWIDLGNEEIRKRGLVNVELELHRAEAILDAARARRGQIDVILLYAVLEHLTVPERLAVLRLSREVVKPGGAIVVCEAPNRLIYFDHHTARMPFFHLLPDELAVEYYGVGARGLQGCDRRGRRARTRRRAPGDCPLGTRDQLS